MWVCIFTVALSAYVALGFSPVPRRGVFYMVADVVLGTRSQTNCGNLN